MLIFEEENILKNAYNAFIEDADFLGVQLWCKKRLLNSSLFKEKNLEEFFQILGLSDNVFNQESLKKIYSFLKDGNLYDAFAIKGNSELNLSEKSKLYSALTPISCPIAELKTFNALNLDFTEKDFFYYAAQCRHLANKLNKVGAFTPYGEVWNVSNVDIVVRYIYK